MEFFSDLIQYGYLSNALAACVLSGITCGVIGTYVVCRRMVFLAGGITHSSFGGLGIAFYLGTDPIAGAMIFAVLSALGIEWAGSRGRIREDSAIGIIWSVGMAVGALFMSLRPGYTSGDLSAYLFGSIVTVTHGDVAALTVLTLFIIAGALLWLRPVMYVAFDRDFARSRGIPTRVISYVMAALIAVTIGLLFIGSIFFLSSFFIKSILVPVSQINATAKRIAAGSYGVQIIDEVKPDPADFVVYKNRFNGFVNTTLEKKLRQMQINTVIMTGWRSDVCVAQTAIEAFYRGFRVAVADDGVNSTTEAEHRQGMQLLAINYNFDFYPCETILENLLQQE